MIKTDFTQRRHYWCPSQAVLKLGNNHYVAKKPQQAVQTFPHSMMQGTEGRGTLCHDALGSWEERSLPHDTMEQAHTQ